MIGDRTSKPGYKNTRKSGYVFKQYCDPAHSWYKVEISFLKRLSIEKNISGWSYVFGNYAYLEEDCDATKLFQRLDELGFKYKVQTEHTNRRSRIRSYERYNIVNI